LDEELQLSPGDALAGLKPRRANHCAIGQRRQSFALGQPVGKLAQLCVMFGEGTSLVRPRRRTGIADADTPVIALRYQHEGKQPARQRLGVVAEALMDAAASLLGEEDTATVRAVVELRAASPDRSCALKGSQPPEVLVAVPALAVNALPFLRGDGDLVFLAAGAADVTVPVLQDREMTDRERHQQLRVTRRDWT